MNQQLILTLRQSEGALLRMLGLVQRRGFEVAALVASAPVDRADWRVDLTLHGCARDLGTLVRQLGKLQDVVSVQQQAAQQDDLAAVARRSAA